MIKFLLFFFLYFIFFQAEAQSIAGFLQQNRAKQKTTEELFQTLPDGITFKNHLQEITKEPHVAGSAASKKVIEYLAGAMENAGLVVEKFDYDIYLDYPVSDAIVEIVRPIRLPLNNKEYIHEEDPFSANEHISVGWNAFSGSGDVTAEVVYANFGRKEDFEKLKEMGVAVEGKIVLARYGGNFRGYKAKYAELAGAAGLIIFTDPKDGGYVSGLVYPEGKFADESTIQRGSVLALDYTGDPLTPFEPALPTGSKKKVKRLAPEAVPFHTIPVTPLPYGAAREIIKRMTGQPVPSSWQGGLPFTYRIEGGTKLQVRLKVDHKKALTRVTNVVGTIIGSDYQDEWIILGSHHDAWEFGAVDPNGGTAMLLSVADALGQLVEAGYQPKRTIKITHWDAEEFGILGSTEWVEQFRDELSEKAVAYLNADAAISGPNFGGAASPTLKQLIIDVTHMVQHPDSGESVYEHWINRQPGMMEPVLGNLGGGSDHVGFYTHIGIPSAGLGISQSSGIYHSAYDNFNWFQKFGDPDFVYGPAMAKIFGLIALRLANADLIPYDVIRYATDLMDHINKVEKEIDQYDKAFKLDDLKSEVEKLAEACKSFADAREALLNQEQIEASLAADINQRLIYLEKSFISDKGLAFGAWYRSLYAAPDPYSGYASWMLPGLRYEASLHATEHLKSLKKQYADAIESLTDNIEDITRKMESGQRGK